MSGSPELYNDQGVTKQFKNLVNLLINYRLNENLDIQKTNINSKKVVIFKVATLSAREESFIKVTVVNDKNEDKSCRILLFSVI